MMYLMYLLIFIIVTYYFFFYQISYEHFNDTNPNLKPYDGFKMFKLVDYNTQCPIYDYKNLNALRFETRFPGLLKHRYSFDDTPVKKNDTSFYDFAKLSQLPIELRNRYYATVSKSLADTDKLLYYPDTTNLKYACQGYSPRKYPYANARGDPFIVTNDSDLFIKKDPIYGYDYHNMYEIATNTAPGTNEFYSDYNKLNSHV